MTEKALRQEIRNAEKELRRLEQQHGNLERLAKSTAERLNKTGDAGDPNAIMEARIRRDAARDMLTENDREQENVKNRIAALAADAERAHLHEHAARTFDDLEAAKGEWRKTAAAAARAFHAAMEDLEAKHARVRDCYAAANAAAVAATGHDGPGVNAIVSWAGLPGVSPVGMLETENMSMQPPMFKTQLAAMTNALHAPRVPA